MTNVLRVDITMVMLVAERAAAKAVAAEVQRQLSEQYPGLELNLSDNSVHIDGLKDLGLVIPGWEIEIV